MRNAVVQCESIMRCGDGAQQPSGPHVSHADGGGFKLAWPLTSPRRPCSFSARGLVNQSRTSIMNTSVLRFRSSLMRVLHVNANFGSGTLALRIPEAPVL